jgi:hypothetical protein
LSENNTCRVRTCTQHERVEKKKSSNAHVVRNLYGWSGTEIILNLEGVSYSMRVST